MINEYMLFEIFFQYTNNLFLENINYFVTP